MTKIIAMDVETYKWNEKEKVYKPILDATQFKLGCAIICDMKLDKEKSTKKKKKFKIENKQTKYFYQPEHMLSWIENIILAQTHGQKPARTYIYGHNMEFDYISIMKGKLHTLRSEHQQRKLIKTGGTLYATHLRKEGKGGGDFLDTMSFYRGPLGEVGELIEKPKMKIPKEIKGINELKPYITRDTEIVLEGILTLKQTLGELGYNPKKITTAATLAMNIYRQWLSREENKKIEKYIFPIQKETAKTKTKNKMLGEYIEGIKKQPEAKETMKPTIIKTRHAGKVRAANRGGRNEAFKMGEWKKATQLDIRAMYPYAMSNMPYPNLWSERLIEKKELTPTRIKTLLNSIGIIRCTVKHKGNWLPLLPIRYKTKVYFPKNRILHGVWTIWEIKEAIKHGYQLIDVEWMIIYNESKINPFKKYMKELYKLRQESKGTMKLTIKILMNSLFGKFGQKSTRTEYTEVNRMEYHKIKKEGWRIIGDYGPKYICQRKTKEYETDYVNPIIPALTTAYARIHIWKFLRLIPEKDLLYVDTDGIVLKGKHLNKFKIGTEMGEWKIEKRENKELENVPCKILGEKRYYIGENVKLAGLPRKQATKSIIDEEKDIESNKMIGILETLRKGNETVAGTFKQKKLKMEPHAKYQDPLPKVIVDKELGIELKKEKER